MFELYKKEYAVVDNNDIVFKVVVADSKEDVEAVCVGLSVKEVVSCYEFGQACEGATWTGTEFLFIEEDPEKPTVFSPTEE